MTKEISMDGFARILLDAFDVDIQIYMGRVLQKLRETDSGEQVAQWANDNKLAFEAILRTVSVVSQRVPLSKSLISESIRHQLPRLPVEIRRVIMPQDSNNAIVQDGNTFMKRREILLRDSIFKNEYEAALEGLGAGDLEFIATLDTSNLTEYVLSPKKLRPYLLNKWRHEIQKKEEINETRKKDIDESLSKLTDWAKEFRAKAENFRDEQRRKRNS